MINTNIDVKQMEQKELTNYEKWVEQWREKFLQMDQEELKNRLPELAEEGGDLLITQFGKQYRINKENGKITGEEDEISNYEQLHIYTLFGYVSILAHYKNDWVPFEKLKDASPFAKAFQEGVIQPFGRMFNGKADALKQAFEKLGAEKVSWSDVGYEWKAFDCIPVRFLFWDGDDEFPAQGNLLFDASATDYIHVESIVTIAALGLTRLAEAAGVEVDRSAFPVF